MVDDSEEDQMELDENGGGIFPHQDETLEDGTEDLFYEAVKMARLLLFEIGQGTLTLGGATADRVLTGLHETIFKALPPELKQIFPKDARGLQALADSDSRFDTPDYFFLDFCPCDQHQFDRYDKSDIKCPHCDEDTRFDIKGLPQRQALYFCIKSYMKRVLSVKAVRDSQLAWTQRRSPPGHFRDTVDGSILGGRGLAKLFQGKSDDEKNHTMCFSQCSDAVIVETGGGKESMTPITAICQTISESFRENFPAVYLAGVLPKGAASAVYLRPVAEMWASVAPDTEGVVLDDGTRWWAQKIFRVEDLGGIQWGIASAKFPATNGACIQCQVTGIWCPHLHTSIYPSSITHTPINSTLRTQYVTIFEGVPAMAEMARSGPPATMTIAAAKESAVRASSDDLTTNEKKLEPYRGPNVWTELLPYFNIVLMSINDPFHEIANTVRDIFNLLRSSNKKSKGMHFSKARKDFERSIGRFLNTAKTKKWKADFQVSLSVQDLLDQYVQSGLMRLPSSWPRVRYIFQYLNRLSCSELLCLAGPLGLYFFCFCSFVTYRNQSR